MPRTNRPSPSQARIEADGGFVWWDRVVGELAVSRAIGDHCFSPFVIAEPEVSIRLHVYLFITLFAIYLLL